MNPLRREREKRQLTKAQMSELCGVTPGEYGRYEEGRRKPEPKRADDMARRLGNAVTRDQLLYPEEYLIPEEEAKAS